MNLLISILPASERNKAAISSLVQKCLDAYEAQIGERSRCLTDAER